MKFILKFKDGMIVDGGDMKDPRIKGEGNVLQLLLDLKKNPEATVNISDKLTRKFSDLYSIEILL